MALLIGLSIALLCAGVVLVVAGRVAVKVWYSDVDEVQSALENAPNVSAVTTHYNSDPFPASIGAKLTITSGGQLNVCCFTPASVSGPTRFFIDVIGQWNLRVSTRRRGGASILGALEVGPGRLSDSLLGRPVLSVADATTHYDEVLHAIEGWPIAPRYACKALPDETVCYSRRDYSVNVVDHPWKLPFEN